MQIYALHSNSVLSIAYRTLYSIKNGFCENPFSHPSPSFWKSYDLTLYTLGNIFSSIFYDFLYFTIFTILFIIFFMIVYHSFAGASLVNPHCSSIQTSLLPFFNRRLSHFGHFSLTGICHTIKSHSGYVSQPKYLLPFFVLRITISPPHFGQGTPIFSR